VSPNLWTFFIASFCKPKSGIPLPCEKREKR
jgi:hypothetical protein